MTVRRDANVSKRSSCAKPVLAIDANGLGSQLVPGDVFEAAKVAAKLLEKQA